VFIQVRSSHADGKVNNTQKIHVTADTRRKNSRGSACGTSCTWTCI